MNKIYLIINKNNCMGCHACEIACKQENELTVGPRLIRVIEQSPDFNPIYCHHCANPLCKNVCPVEAIIINELGIVLIDNNICNGCRECIEACPFGAMQFNEKKKVAVKCNLCIERLKYDKQPSCMSVCPTKCIQLGGVKNIANLFERKTEFND